MENDELATYLNALARDECCRVEKVLKASDREITELVSFVGENQAVWGPFVRKRIKGDARMGSAYRELFAARQASRRFRHLPSIYDVHERDGWLIVLMEYVQGRTLHEEVYRCDPSLEVACRWFPALCDGVIELHEDFPVPLIHRDLKPANIIVNGSNLTIIDFGITRTFRIDGTADTAPFATRAYAPPEQFGYGQTDVRSDVYALGMVLYFLLTERNPEPDLVKKGFDEPEVPAALRPVLLRATAFDPEARFQSVRALKGAFAEAVTSLVSQGAPSGAPQGVPGGVPQGGAPAPWAATGQPTGAPGAMPQMGTQSSMPAGASQPAFRTAPMPQSGVPQAPGVAPASYQAAAPQGVPYQGYGVPAGAYPPPTAPSAGVPINGVPTSASGKPPLKVSEVIGAIWDGFLLLYFALFTGIALQMPFNPTPDTEKYPLGMSLGICIGLAIMNAGITYALMDKRILRRYLPFMGKQTFGKSLLAGLILFMAGLALAMVVSVLSSVGAVQS